MSPRDRRLSQASSLCFVHLFFHVRLVLSRAFSLLFHCSCMLGRCFPCFLSQPFPAYLAFHSDHHIDASLNEAPPQLELDTDPTDPYVALLMGHHVFLCSDFPPFFHQFSFKIGQKNKIILKKKKRGKSNQKKELRNSEGALRRSEGILASSERIVRVTLLLIWQIYNLAGNDECQGNYPMPKLSLNNILFFIMNKSETRVCSHFHAFDSLGVEVTVLKILGQLHV